MNGGLDATNGDRRDLCSAARVDVALGVLLGLALAASLAAGWRLVRAPRVQDPSSSAMQSAVHAATSLLPHLRRGLGADSAPPAAPHLRTLTGASAVALADTEQLLAFDGAGSGHHRPGDPAGGPRRRGARRPRARGAAAAVRRARLPAAVGDRGAAGGARPPHRRARRALRPPGPAAAGGDARRRRGGRARLGDGRAVGDGGAGRAARARRAASASRPDLPALHLQRAGRGRLVHPLAARRRRASC